MQMPYPAEINDIPLVSRCQTAFSRPLKEKREKAVWQRETNIPLRSWHLQFQSPAQQ